MKIKSTKNLIAVGVLALMVLGAQKASAYVPGVWDPQPRVDVNEPAYTKVPTTYDAPVLPQIAPVPQTTYVSYVPAEQPQITYVAARPATTNRVVYTTAPATNNQVIYTQVPANANQSSNLPPVVNGYQGQQDPNAQGFTSDAGAGNGLAALSLGGSGGFLPSSVWQWLLLVALILVVIIIARSFKKPDVHHVAVH